MDTTGTDVASATLRVAVRDGAVRPTGEAATEVALAHDYLTQRGGAERVALSLTHAFPDAPLYTSLYEPESTFPELAEVDVRTMPLDRVGPLRSHHRLALPLLAPAFSRLDIPADVLVCSSSGWAHGARTPGRKVVYCHTPARWLYQTAAYLRGRASGIRATARVLQPALRRWDVQAARSADRYLANSTAVAERIRQLYGRTAEVVPPPPAVTPDGETHELAGIAPGFVLCVSRLLPYKNVDAVVRAFARLPGERLVVVGSGPMEHELRAVAGRNVAFLGRVGDEELRYLYGRCRLLVAASYEDFGLTPLEAAGFGKPSVALRWGGFLDTIEEQRTGLFFDEPAQGPIAEAIRTALDASWDEPAILRTAERFSEQHFIERVQAIVGRLAEAA